MLAKIYNSLCILGKVTLIQNFCSTAKRLNILIEGRTLFPIATLLLPLIYLLVVHHILLVHLCIKSRQNRRGLNEDFVPQQPIRAVKQNTDCLSPPMQQVTPHRLPVTQPTEAFSHRRRTGYSGEL